MWGAVEGSGEKAMALGSRWVGGDRERWGDLGNRAVGLTGILWLWWVGICLLLPHLDTLRAETQSCSLP